MASTDIAIVGMACRFAGNAKTPEAFYEMLRGKQDAWSEVPHSRFNAKAFQHPSRDRRGTMVCKGGYFLDQDVTKWDAPFFACSASEARAFDPQQRLLLEVAYESLENAGIPIEDIAGTDAACFVGGFSEDYKSIVSRDVHAMPQYAKTGNSLSMLSNRISWFFDMRGPSVTCDTACSSSMTALHLASETIRSNTNSTRCALVGGANLILDADDHCALNALGFLSPDSRCFSFDSKANGYARGEGVGIIVLKHIDDAIRDGDRIRAVIRGTGLNSDGRTAGIVLPSREAQERLILNTYKMANLDPSDTQYVELHGTGTKVGDPAEVGAIASTIAVNKEQPLYCGSVKSRIGHTEGAAGVAAIIKCVLGLENGVITPNLNFEKANPKLRLEKNGIIVPTSAIPWPECEVRRCSINNFGFGGVNAHAILDDAHNYLRLRTQSAFSLVAVQTQSRGPQARLFVLSAPQQDAIARQRHSHAEYVRSCSSTDKLAQIASTLAQRRSQFQWRHAVVASSLDEVVSQWRDDTLAPVKVGSNPSVAFVFTGQGAQWFAMGRELCQFNVFAASLHKSAACLMDMGCSWDAWAELMAPESTSLVNKAEYSQPLCLILQIALVDLLADWGVRPSAVVGHSSGEIAAAYAANALCRKACIKVAFHRGLVSKLAAQRNPDGSMMAVGLGEEKVLPYLTEADGAVVVACVNSPQSVTLAGDSTEMRKIEAVLTHEKHFCRRLQVENAYHSPQMDCVSDIYQDSLRDLSPNTDSSVAFYSTVDGHQVSTSELTADYWARNMCSAVQLVAALDDMLHSSAVTKHHKIKSKSPNLLLEIGPHSALAGPIKQFKTARGSLEHLGYTSLLIRSQHAAVTALGAMGYLWTRGVPIKLSMLNNAGPAVDVLTDMPCYPWDHSTSYWHESRQSRNHRLPQFSKHDLVGSMLDSHNPLEPTWRNHIRLAELPWLRDHKVNSDVVFPAAGMICSMIEAARQMSEAEDSAFDIIGYELRELSISQALVLSDDENGVEIQVSLKRRKVGMGSGPGFWHECSFYSCQEGDVFIEHAAALIQIQRSKAFSEVDGGREEQEEIMAQHKKLDVNRAVCVEGMPSSSHFRFCDDVGLHFGKTFQGLTKIRHQDGTVAFDVKVVDTRASMPAFRESGYVLHPTTLDAILQGMLVAPQVARNVERQAWVPTGAASIQISSTKSHNYGAILQGAFDTSVSGVRDLSGSCVVRDGLDDVQPCVIINDLKFTGLGARDRGLGSSCEQVPTPYASVVWKPDLSLTDGDGLRDLAQSNLRAEDMIQFCSAANSLVNEMCRLALPALDRSSDSLAPHLLKYATWMQTRCSYKTSGVLTPSGRQEPLAPGEPLPEPHGMASFMKKYPVDGHLLLHVYKSLEAIYSGKTTPIASLMENEYFSRFYREAFGIQVNMSVLRSWFELKAHKQPGLRILEIGAGTASTTRPVLEQLGRDAESCHKFSHWMFTDISAGWFENAKNALVDWKSRVNYKVLDIDNDPIEQGFDLESYDVVLAVNVLHATKDVAKTLHNCNKLLKPGGNLVLGEYTNPSDLVHFIFGTLPGWWAANDGRQLGPLLSQPQWDEALRKQSFSGADIALKDNDDPSAHRMSTIISTKLQVDSPVKNVSVVIKSHSADPTKVLAWDICCRFRRAGHQASVVNITEALTATSGDTAVVSLLDFDEPYLDNIKQADFETVQHLLLHSQEVLWVTRSDPADEPSHPAKRLISGLLRCLKTEDASRRLFELHLSRPNDSGNKSTGEAVCRRLFTIWSEPRASNVLDEMETVEKDGRFCISRYQPDDSLNDSLSRVTQANAKAQNGRLWQNSRPLKMVVGQPGMLDSLHFVDDDAALRPLTGHEVEIEVVACGLNFLDIMIAMGQLQRPSLGYEAAGLVRRVGPDATRVSPGDRVLYIGPGAMRTNVRCHELAVHKLPDKISLEDGVAIPIAYATAYQSLVEVARLQPAESVLIHAAAGGLGQALIQIATMLKAEIFCTVGSLSKKEAVMALGVRSDHIFSSRDLTFAKGIKRTTNGRGVDVVVNSLAGEALRQTWGCLAPYGRFVEVGKKDIMGNTGLDMQPFLHNVIFAGVNLEAMMIHEPLRCSELVSKVLNLFDQGLIDGIRPVAVHDFSEAESVFRAMQRGTHVGKLVLQITADSEVPIMPPKMVPLQLRSDATYVLVGGLGGLGRAQAQFMVQNGARHLAFISRSGNARAEAKTLLKKLQASGVTCNVYAADVADQTKLQEALNDITHSMPPIRGVIQGAMVLDDRLFHRMTYAQWVAAIKPKVLGTWNLHELLPRDMDFFIVLSSLAGIIGSVSQGNYAAGNTFQDALIHYRRAKGLAGTSLDLGIMKSIGYVEENEDIGAKLSQFKLASVEEDQFMHLLRCALAGTTDGTQPISPQVVVGAGNGGIEQAARETDPDVDFYWLRTLAPFAHLRQMGIKTLDSASPDGRRSQDNIAMRLIECKTMDEAHEAAQDILLTKIANIISLPVADINTAKPLYTYGVDSLVAVELRNWLATEIKTELSIFDLTGSAPICDVSRKIADRSHLVTAEVKASN